VGGGTSSYDQSRSRSVNAYRKSEKAFRGRNDQWFAEVALDLAAEKMEILRRGRWKGDVHVHVPVHLPRFKVVIRELVTTLSQ
jgi:hypothetical protein